MSASLSNTQLSPVHETTGQTEKNYLIYDIKYITHCIDSFFKDMDTFIQQGQIKIVETIKNYKITKMCTF